MAVPITVPRLGWSMEEGTFVEWLKCDGDPVRPGEPLFVLESEKAAENIEALDPGILRIPPDGPKPGATVKVGQVLAHLTAEGEAAPTARPAAPAVETASAPPVPAHADTPAAAGPTVAGPAVRRLARTLGVELERVAGSGAGGRITEADVRQQARPTAPSVAEALPARPGKPASSPRARRAARELGIDWSTLQGSGRNGRIRERDVRAAATSVSEGRVAPHPNVRRIIAARMVAGVTQAAPVTLTTKADATNLVNLRSQFQAAAAAPDEIAPSYTDLILKLSATALRQHPQVQAQWRDEGLFAPERIHIALAVDTEAGLLVPVLRDVDRLTLRQVAVQARELIALARGGRLSADQMRDATFTVTNLGMFGVDAFTPIIQLPQAAVLGVGRIVREPAVIKDKIVPRQMLTLNLTFDHRVLDGAPAARFLDALRRCIEQPVPHLLA